MADRSRDEGSPAPGEPAQADAGAGEADRALAEVVARAGYELVEARPFSVDEGQGDEASEGTTKGIGYGRPLKLLVRDAEGAECHLVFHTATVDFFGHDRRADRAAEVLLGYDTFGLIPDHVKPLDVGAIRRDKKGLVSLAEGGEFYLLTSYGEGHVYADELRRIAHEKTLTERDRAHCDALAHALVRIHSLKQDDGRRYTRSVRDVVGSGEGVFGIIDGYPDDVPAAPLERLRALEERVLRWRWKLRGRQKRLCRSHGDFHPFNIVFDDDSTLTLLDAARGCLGDPADDVTCLAINYVFFAVETPGAWQAGFRELWQRFWRVYVQESGDGELFEVVAPFLAWRGLVVCNPVWYPGVEAEARDRVLGFIERTLEAERFDPGSAETVFQ